jgi:hypothetical protein
LRLALPCGSGLAREEAGTETWLNGRAFRQRRKQRLDLLIPQPPLPGLAAIQQPAASAAFSCCSCWIFSSTVPRVISLNTNTGLSWPMR